MGYRISEDYKPREYRAQYQTATPAYQPYSPGNRLGQIAAQTAEEGRERARGIREMVETPIKAFQTQRDRSLQRAQIQDQREMQALQRQKIAEDLELDREFGRREREAQLGAAEDDRVLSELQRKEAEERSAVLGQVDDEGRTVRERQILAPLEQSQRQAQIAERQLDIQEQAAIGNAELRQKQLKQAQLGIDAIEQANRIEQLQVQIGAERDPARQAQLIEQLKGNGADSYEVAKAIKNIKDAQTRAQMSAYVMQSMNPLAQNRQERALKAQEEMELINRNVAEIDNRIRDLKEADPTTDEAQTAANALADIFESYGYASEANQLRRGFSVEPGALLSLNFKGVISSREEIAKKLRNKVMRRASKGLQSAYGGAGGFTQVSNFATNLERQSYSGSSQIQEGNMFVPYQAPQVPSVSEMVPEYMVPGTALPQAPIVPGQAGVQFMRGPDGQIQMAQPGQTQGNPILDALRRGQPRQQVGAQQ